VYVEKAYSSGCEPSALETQRLCEMVVEELRSWGWISDVEVIDPTWIDVAYTYSWPNSGWIQNMVQRLQEKNVYQVGRYARWICQGVADSIRDGLLAGSALLGANARELEGRIARV
jgi:hypothetical protein